MSPSARASVVRLGLTAKTPLAFIAFINSTRSSKSLSVAMTSPSHNGGCAYQKPDLGESGVGDGFLEATGGSGERTALVLFSKSRAFADGRLRWSAVSAG